MISKSDLKKPLNSLTKLDAEKVSRYKREEAEEELEVLGQESDRKAAPWVVKYVEALNEKERRRKDLCLEILTGLLKKKKDYFRFLTNIFIGFAQEEDIPRKYQLDIDLTDIGLVVKIRKTKYYGAFKVTGLPIYDYRACKILSVKVGNTIAKLEGYQRKSQGGVFLSDSEDLRKYGT